MVKSKMSQCHSYTHILILETINSSTFAREKDSRVQNILFSVNLSGCSSLRLQSFGFCVSKVEEKKTCLNHS